MWITRAALDALQRTVDQLQRDLQVEQLKNTLLERQLATSQANVDWLRVFANQLSQDRTAIAASKGIDLPGPAIEGRLQTAAEVQAQAAAVAAGGGPTLEVGRALDVITRAESVDEALAGYSDTLNGFEDVGDAEATRLGVKHNETDGTLEYTR